MNWFLPSGLPVLWGTHKEFAPPSTTRSRAFRVVDPTSGTVLILFVSIIKICEAIRPVTSFAADVSA